jgi:hypothetical protein
VSKISPAVRDLILTFDRGDKPEDIYNFATALQSELGLTANSPTKPLTRICIYLVMGLSRLAIEPTNGLSVEQFQRTADLLRLEREPRLALLAEWYVAVGLLMREFPPGVMEPPLRTRHLEEVAGKFLDVGTLAVLYDDTVRASLANSLAAEMLIYLGQHETALRWVKVANGQDDGRGHELLELRRKVNEAMLASLCRHRPPMSMEYGTYLCTPGELLAAIDAQ